MTYSIPEIFEALPDLYRAGAAQRRIAYYFSLGPHRYTVVVDPDDGCTVQAGKQQCDVVLKTTEKIFLGMVMRGRPPGPIDIARGRFKTNNPTALTQLRTLFDWNG